MDYFEAKCSLCPKHFTSSKALSKHKLQVHIVADNEIGCEECGKKLKNEYQLKLHQRNVHVKKTCELCNVEVSVGNFSRHKRETHKVLDSVLNNHYNCKNCKKSFTRNENLEKHIKSCRSVFVNETVGYTQLPKKLPNPLETLKCSVCGKDCSKKKYLAAHMKTHEPKIVKEAISCNFCDTTFSKNSNLLKHVKSKHPRPEVISVQTVGFFIPAEEASENMDSNANKIPLKIFQCNRCDFKCYKKVNLDAHKKSVHVNLSKEKVTAKQAKELQCSSCHESFLKSKYLKAHMKTHGPKVREDPLSVSKCGVCEKEFENKRYLKAHIKTHESKPEKESHPCNYCDKSFANKRSLRKHIKSKHPIPSVVKNDTIGFLIFDTPSNKRPTFAERFHTFNCDYCDFVSEKKFNFDRHVEQVHVHPSKVNKPQGRKQMDPNTWSPGTKIKYARNEKKNFAQKMKDFNLETEVEYLFLKDFKMHKQVSKATEKEVINMISDFELSDKKMMSILKKFKEIFGKDAFTPGIREALLERKKTVRKYFKREQTTFEGSDEGEVLERHLIYTEDLDTLLDFICFERGVDKESSDLAVGMDSGQKRLLVTLTVNAEEKEKEAGFKDTSPKKVIILAHVDDVPETYLNVAKLLDKLNIHHLYQKYEKKLMIKL